VLIIVFSHTIQVPHKDTEKEIGMFGTLVITLPSDFEGGELIVSHLNTSKTFKPVNTEYRSYYTAFYADCTHEIRPISRGYRLVLVYNLVMMGSDEPPQPPTDISEEVNAVLTDWKRQSDWPSKVRTHNLMILYDLTTLQKVGFILEHSYTQRGLSFGLLKNKDRSMVEILLKTLNEEDYELCLGSVALHRSGMNNYNDYNGDNFKFEDDGGGYTISNLINKHGQNVTFNRKRIDSYGKQSNSRYKHLLRLIIRRFPAKTLGWTQARCRRCGTYWQ